MALKKTFKKIHFSNGEPLLGVLRILEKKKNFLIYFQCLELSP